MKPGGTVLASIHPPSPIELISDCDFTKLHGMYEDPTSWSQNAFSPAPFTPLPGAQASCVWVCVREI